MAANEDLFQKQDTAAVPDHIIKWYMVTNHRNLFFMLASGMVMPPAGFGGKYYEDPLSFFPGWIPIFPDQVPKDAIQHAGQERGHLIPCILEVDLSSVRGSAKSVGHDGSVADIGFPGGVSGDEAFVLLPAPLPVTWVLSVIFESKEHKISCEKDASDFDNVDLSGCSLRSVKSLFTKAAGVRWPEKIAAIPERDAPLERPLAMGSMLAVLSHIGNRGDLAISAAKLAFGQRGVEEDISRYRLMTPLGNWCGSAEESPDHGVSATLYWRLVDSLISARDKQGGDRAPVDVVLAALQAGSSDMDSTARESIEKLVKDLTGLVGLGEHTATELFERHAKPLPRALILFFLKDSCEEFLEFRHGFFTEYDYVTAAILFAVRERWLGLPVSLRKMPGLNGACCHRMAVMSHKLAGSSLDLGEPPARPQSLRELLRDRPWKKAQAEAAVLLARKCAWDCIRTRVSLGKGQYRLEIDGQGLHFILEGEPKAVQTEADYDAVLRLLAEAPVPDKVEIAVRILLKD